VTVLTAISGAGPMANTVWLPAATLLQGPLLQMEAVGINALKPSLPYVS